PTGEARTRATRAPPSEQFVRAASERLRTWSAPCLSGESTAVPRRRVMPRALLHRKAFQLLALLQSGNEPARSNPPTSPRISLAIAIFRRDLAALHRIAPPGCHAAERRDLALQLPALLLQHLFHGGQERKQLVNRQTVDVWLSHCVQPPRP